jgi:hypothetical protein
MKDWRETWIDWGRFLASMPLVLSVILLSRSVSIRLASGRWSSHLDYYPASRLARMLLDIHEVGLVIPALVATVLCLPLWVLVTAMARPGLRETGTQVLVFAFGVAVFFLWLA